MGETIHTDIFLSAAKPWDLAVFCEFILRGRGARADAAEPTSLGPFWEVTVLWMFILLPIILDIVRCILKWSLVQKSDLDAGCTKGWPSWQQPHLFGTTMKNYILIAAAVLQCALGEGIAGEAVTSYGTFGPGGYVNGGAGFGFTPLTNLSVTSLGYSQAGLSGYSSGIVDVTLYDSSGNLLSAALVTVADSLFNQSYYHSVSPVTLTAGLTYYVGAVEQSSGLWLGNVNIANDFSVAPNISYLGVANGPNYWQNLQGGTASDLYIGANFQLAVVPEPTSMAVCALALACLASLRARRKK